LLNKFGTEHGDEPSRLNVSGFNRGEKF
jgi:hypothetical protein